MRVWQASVNNFKGVNALKKTDRYSPPDEALEALARCLIPAIRSYYESEEGRREYAEYLKTCTTKPPGQKAAPDKKVGQVA